MIFGVGRTIEGTAGGERSSRCEHPRACRTRGGNSGKRAANDPRGTSLGEVLSCRFFDLGKGALRLKILVDRMSSASCAWTLGPRDRGIRQHRLAERLKGSREAVKPAMVNAGQGCRRRLIRDHCVGKRFLGRSWVEVRSASFGLFEADADVHFCRTLRNLGINFAGLETP